jgi:hypothetical protein
MIDSAGDCALENTNNSYQFLSDEKIFDSGLLSKAFQSSLIQDYFKSSSNLNLDCNLRPSNVLNGNDNRTLRKKEDSPTQPKPQASNKQPTQRWPTLPKPRNTVEAVFVSRHSQRRNQKVFRPITTLSHEKNSNILYPAAHMGREDYTQDNRGDDTERCVSENIAFNMATHLKDYHHTSVRKAKTYHLPRSRHTFQSKEVPALCIALIQPSSPLERSTEYTVVCNNDWSKIKFVPSGTTLESLPIMFIPPFDMKDQATHITLYSKAKNEIIRYTANVVNYVSQCYCYAVEIPIRVRVGRTLFKNNEQHERILNAQELFTNSPVEFKFKTDLDTDTQSKIMKHLFFKQLQFDAYVYMIVTDTYSQKRYEVKSKFSESGDMHAISIEPIHEKLLAANLTEVQSTSDTAVSEYDFEITVDLVEPIDDVTIRYAISDWVSSQLYFDNDTKQVKSSVLPMATVPRFLESNVVHKTRHSWKNETPSVLHMIESTSNEEKQVEFFVETNVSNEQIDVWKVEELLVEMFDKVAFIKQV